MGLSFACDQDSVEALVPDRANPAFGVRVGARRLWRCPGDLDAGGAEHRVEHGGELGIAVAQQEPEPVDAIVKVHQQVAGLVGNPRAGGMNGHPGHVHLSGAELDEDRVLSSTKNST